MLNNTLENIVSISETLTNKIININNISNTFLNQSDYNELYSQLNNLSALLTSSNNNNQPQLQSFTYNFTISNAGVEQVNGDYKRIQNTAEYSNGKTTIFFDTTINRWRIKASDNYIKYESLDYTNNIYFACWDCLKAQGGIYPTPTIEFKTNIKLTINNSQEYTLTKRILEGYDSEINFVYTEKYYSEDQSIQLILVNDGPMGWTYHLKTPTINDACSQTFQSETDINHSLIPDLLKSSGTWYNIITMDEYNIDFEKPYLSSYPKLSVIQVGQSIVFGDYYLSNSSITTPLGTQITPYTNGKCYLYNDPDNNNWYITPKDNTLYYYYYTNDLSSNIWNSTNGIMPFPSVVLYQ